MLPVLNKRKMWLQRHVGERGVSVPGTGLEDVVRHPSGPLEVISRVRRVKVFEDVPADLVG